VEYRLLGPLEVHSGDGLLELGGAKQRAVLAVLLLSANEVVPTERLIDDVWGERAPRTATAYVHNCVSRLRRALGRETLETRPPGYVLHADRDTIDARRFERLLREARETPAAERAAILQEALALWRGPALADFAFEEFARGEIDRLDELRLTAIEDRIAAELELGRHADVVGELEALANRYAERERLRGLEMLALYRSGRQVEALRVYQEARLALVELGLEPGEELRALERMILSHDPALDVAAPAAAAPAPITHEVRKTASLVFAELVFPDRVDAEVGRRVTARCLAELTALVEEHGGAIEQLLGEELAAVFGVPVAHEDDALRAVRTAIAAREEIDRVAAETGVRVGVRVGVETGELLVGGDGPRLAGSAVGDARRVKDAAAPGEIQLGPGALRLVAAAVDVVPAGDAYRLLALAEDAIAVPRRLDAPLVGRADELAALRAALVESADQRICRRIVVVGEPGIGKSRLAAELVAGLSPEVLALTGRCIPYGAGATYLPLAEALRQALGPGEPAEALETLLAGDERRDEVVRLVSGVLGAAEAGQAGETAWAVRRLLETLAAERPLLLVLEDVHWAEPALLDLVEYLVGWSEGAPIAILCLARSELAAARPEWGRDAIALERLSQEESRALLAGLPDVEAPAEMVVAAAEGNPLFLEQLAVHASDAGPEAAMPPSLEALLASRLDRLSPDERGVIERAAIAGREFTRAAVDALSPPDEAAAAGPLLLGLVRRRWLRPDLAADPGEDGFRFDHMLVRDAAYAAVPKTRRAELHERLARWLDERPGALDEIVGFHLEQAVLFRAELGEDAYPLAAEASSRLGEAALAAWRRIDHHAALGLYKRAVALLPAGSPERLPLECNLGVALKNTGRADEAVELLDRVIQAAGDVGAQPIVLRAHIEAAMPRLMAGAISPADLIALVDDAIPELEAASDELGLARAWHMAASVEVGMRGRADRCVVGASNAVAHYMRAGFPSGAAGALQAHAALWGSQPVPRAIALCRQLVADQPSELGATPYVRYELAQLHALAGDVETARSEIKLSRDGLGELGDRSALQTTWTFSAARVEALAARLDVAASMLETACESLRTQGERAWLATHASKLADVMLRLDRPDDAASLVDEAAALALVDDLVPQTGWRRVRARLLARAGSAEEGERVAREALAMLDGSDDLCLRGETLLDLAEVLRFGEEDAKAGEAATDALGLFEMKESSVLVDLARRAISRIDADGSPGRAGSPLPRLPA
jgi:DNA-binding SARP family transcriptional activator/tetratricopeptide (TPR) repeat protein